MSIVCFECGKTAEHNHHIIPKVLGGTRTVPLCTDCHGLVHDRNITRHSELQKKGIAKAKEEGKYKGRKPGTKNRRTVENNASVERARELKDQGVNVTKISHILNVSRPTIYAWLKE